MKSHFSGNKLTLLCNQEHFLLKSTSYKIKKALPGYFVLIKPAIKTTHDKGRPKGGLFTAVPDILKNEVKDVSPAFWRTQAIILKIGSSRILLINTYFPTDPGTVVLDENELFVTLQSIREVIEGSNFDRIIWLGDLNADFVRKTGHVKCVENFINENNLIKACDNFKIDFTHCQEINDITHTSTVDHILWNETTNDAINDAGVIHITENSSDHCPVYCELTVPLIPPVDFHVRKPAPPKPSWSRATQVQRDDFKNHLEEALLKIKIPVSIQDCHDVHCDDPAHSEIADDIIVDILLSIEKAAYGKLPVPAQPKLSIRKSSKPGWQELVHPYRESAQFWFQVWDSAGRPLNSQLHQIMKRTRNLFHYQVRKLRKVSDNIAKNKLLDACLHGDGDLFSEIKRIRKSEPCVATSMDGVTVGVDDHFKDIYGNLYNSVDDDEELDILAKQVDKKVNICHLHDVMKVTPEVVKEAAKNLRDSKTDPVYNFSSDCIKNGPDILFSLLASVFRIFLMHGKVSIFLLLATLVPLIKDKMGSINESKNYRSIALSSLVLKLLDWIILILFGDTLGVDELQFAYQPGSSTSMCTWAAVETINYFMRNGTNVYACLMDMTKAFDLVKHSLLFKKLLAGGLSVIFVRLLLFIYMNQFGNVNWNGNFSDIFPIRNGVRQGAILSGILYCFYTNDLFTILRRNGSGCWIGSVFAGIYGYSDDNLILAPSIDSLQEMLITCENYAAEHNLKFSTNDDPAKCKTKCIAFQMHEKPLSNVELGGVPLPWVEGGLHLGNTLSNKVNGMGQDIRKKRAAFISKNNELNQEFWFSHPFTKVSINLIYNFHFTGSPTWDLFCKEAVMLENTWNTAVRIMYDLPLQTHRYLIEPVSEVKHLKFVLIERFLGFLEQIQKSRKIIPKHILNYAKSDVRSITGSNARNILLLTEKHSIDDVSKYDIKELKLQEIAIEDRWKINFIKEIIEIKNNQLGLNEFTIDELTDILRYLCTS